MQSIGVGIIVKNAEKTIRECIESFIKEVDQCVVVMGGESTDNTKDILDELVEKYKPNLELYSFKWVDDFSAARNYSFSKLKTDWLLWVDADDVVINAEKLRTLAEGSRPEVGAIWFPYHYAVDEFGNPTTIYERERLLRAQYGWVWKSRLHETVSPLRQCQYVRSDEVILLHRHLAGDPRHERNMRILEIMLKESPEDKRVWLYLGHQNFAGTNWMDAAEWYLKFGNDKGAIPIERYQSLCYCSRALRQMEDAQACEAALMAITLFPQYKDGYLELAHSYNMIGDSDKAIHWALLSDSKEPLITEPPHVIFVNPLEYTFNKYLMLSDCYMKKGEFEKCRSFAQQAYEIRPTPELQGNVDYLKSIEQRERVDRSIKTLAVELCNCKETAKLKPLLDCIPYWYRDLAPYKELEGGCERYLADVEDKAEIVAGKNGDVTINLRNVTDLEKLVNEIGGKYSHVTLIAPIPNGDSEQVIAYAQDDLEKIVASGDNHIINLRREPSRIVCEYDKNFPSGLGIRMFIGQGFENWTPQTIKEIGCGGSETSAACLAHEFAQRDNNVILYGMDNQVWDGVIYRHFSSFRPDSVPCSLFLASRVPQVFEADIPALQKWLWLHDIHSGKGLSPAIAEKLDVIITLSKWHAGHIKRVYPFLKNARVIDLDNNPLLYDDQWTATSFEDEEVANLPTIAIIGDAIEVTKFKNLKEKRHEHRFIWCSSVDRGLEQVLAIWPYIKKEWEDAELKIFYGWNYFDATLWIPQQRQLKARLQKLIKQDGVEWCNRVGQDQLAIELAQSSGMIYPPPHDFRETYGIAFLEAQAAGVICFYRQNGALGETINKRGIPLPNDATPEEVARIVIKTLNDKARISNLRKVARLYALKKSWSRQTDKLIKLYRRLSDEKRVDELALPGESLQI